VTASNVTARTVYSFRVDVHTPVIIVVNSHYLCSYLLPTVRPDGMEMALSSSIAPAAALARNKRRNMNSTRNEWHFVN